MPNVLDLDTRFSQQPQANIPRSVIPRKSDLKTTMKFGKLYPIYLDEILPADSKKISLGSLVRMATPLFPVMDSSYLDFYAFFVPNRLVWTHWEEFMGENKDSAWVSDVQYSIPSLAPSGVSFDYDREEGFLPDGIYDHFGLPTNVPIREGVHISALPLRAYNLIWNEWFRDQNYQNPIQLNTGDDDSNNTYTLLDVNKLHDEFTSVLPEPQKGEAVSLLFNGGIAPVVSTSFSQFTGDEGSFMANYIKNWEDVHGVPFDEDGVNSWLHAYTNSSGDSSGHYDVIVGAGGLSSGSGILGRSSTVETGNLTIDRGIQVTNLIADMSKATISTINQLRNAIVVQQYLEALALGGSRYTEIIRRMFGVISPDARLQRPELLGHIRLDIEMQQVVQTSFQGGEGETTPLGNTGAYSKTTGYEFLFDKSFVEHGHLLILACARTEQSYQQGLERLWSRKAVTDFFNPIFANIGNQPILNERIYFSSDEQQNKEVFGYQEAWSEYRYKPNRVSGAFRSNHPQSLDAWHYAQYFQTLPKAGADFLKQDSDVVDRTLAVQEDAQLLCNFFFDEVATRPMPVYSIPGLDVL